MSGPRIPALDPRIPALGPRGEGWVVLQVILLLAIPLEAWRETSQSAAASVDPSVPVVGGVVLLAGLGLLLLSAAVLRASGSFSVLPRPLESGSLVANGPYRFVRHPIYAGVILSAVGIALIRASLAIGVLALLLAIVLDLKRRREEGWLSARYPDYDAYRIRTRALVPFLY